MNKTFYGISSKDWDIGEFTHTELYSTRDLAVLAAEEHLGSYCEAGETIEDAIGYGYVIITKYTVME